MWALHEDAAHNTDYKSSYSKQNSDKEKNKVTFVAAVIWGNQTDKDDDEPKIQVNNNLLTNAKTYLAKFQDFQQGGSSS